VRKFARTHAERLNPLLVPAEISCSQVDLRARAKKLEALADVGSRSATVNLKVTNFTVNLKVTNLKYEHK